MGTRLTSFGADAHPCALMNHAYLRCAGQASLDSRAALALGNIGDSRAVEPLTEALEDKDSDVREAAKKALDKIKAKKS